MEKPCHHGGTQSPADGDELGAVVVAFPDEIKLGIIRHVSHVVGAHEDDVEGWAGLEGVLHYAFDDVSVLIPARQVFRFGEMSQQGVAMLRPRDVSLVEP